MLSALPSPLLCSPPLHSTTLQLPLRPPLLPKPRIPPRRAPLALQIPELALRISCCLRVVDELVHEGALALRAGEVLGRGAAEGEWGGDDGADLE